MNHLGKLAILPIFAIFSGIIHQSVSLISEDGSGVKYIGAYDSYQPKIYAGQPISRDASLSYNAPTGGNSGGYSGGNSGGYSGGGHGGGSQMYSYQLIPDNGMSPGTSYGAVSDYDEEDEDDDGGGVGGLLGGGVTQSLCIAKLLGMKGKKKKLLKKIKKLKWALKAVKLFPFVAPLLLPLLLLPILIKIGLLLLFPIAVVPGSGNFTRSPFLPFIVSGAREFMDSSSNFSRSLKDGKYNPYEKLQQSLGLLKSEECVEKIICEIGEGADAWNLRSKLILWIDKKFGESWSKRIANLRGLRTESCSKFKCKELEKIKKGWI